MTVRLFLPAVSLLLAVSGVSCSSSSSGRQGASSSSPASNSSFAQRMASSHKRMNDPNARSQFDKAAQASFTRGKSSDWLAGKQFKADRFSAKSYQGAKAFEGAGNYDGGRKRSSLGNQSFAQSKKSPAEAGRTFDTGTSSLAGQRAREGGMQFEGGNEVFRTSPNRDALRSQEKNDRPKFIELEEYQRDPAYSEDQVKRLLGRG